MLFIRNPEKGLSLAENILLMLRPNGIYTELEAKVLDIALILHAEHGGGNNSTFTTHVVTSSRNRYLFFFRSFHRFPERTPSWWSQPESAEHVCRHQSPCQRLDR